MINKLNIGCGKDIKEGFINLDKIQLPKGTTNIDTKYSLADTNKYNILSYYQFKFYKSKKNLDIWG
jgi:hypothetical protein